MIDDVVARSVKRLEGLELVCSRKTVRDIVSQQNGFWPSLDIFAVAASETFGEDLTVKVEFEPYELYLGGVEGRVEVYRSAKLIYSIPFNASAEGICLYEVVAHSLLVPDLVFIKSTSIWLERHLRQWQP